MNDGASMRRAWIWFERLLGYDAVRQMRADIDRARRTRALVAELRFVRIHGDRRTTQALRHPSRRINDKAEGRLGRQPGTRGRRRGD